MYAPISFDLRPIALDLSPTALLSAWFSHGFYLFFQHFFRSDVMEDGQVAGVFAPDRTEEDPEDLEYHGVVSESEPGSEDGSSDDTDDNKEVITDAATGASDTGAAV